MPKGYIYAEVEITDEAEFKKYQPPAVASLAAFGGRIIVMGGDPKVLEGGQNVRMSVLVEFDSRERASEWYHSPEYQAAIPIRQRGANTHLVLLTGHAEG